MRHQTQHVACRIANSGNIIEGAVGIGLVRHGSVCLAISEHDLGIGLEGGGSPDRYGSCPRRGQWGIAARARMHSCRPSRSVSLLRFRLLSVVFYGNTGITIARRFGVLVSHLPEDRFVLVVSIADPIYRCSHSRVVSQFSVFAHKEPGLFVPTFQETTYSGAVNKRIILEGVFFGMRKYLTNPYIALRVPQAMSKGAVGSSQPFI